MATCLEDFEIPADTPRTPQEVAQRCVVLYAIVAAGHETSREILIQWLRLSGLWHLVSPDERAFFEAQNPGRKHFLNATWRVEALFVLLWSLGRIAELQEPIEICDVPLVQSVLPDLCGPVSDFVSTAALRPEESIDDALEATYQAHWAIRDAEIHGKPIPNGLNPGVVRERHHALNWLVGYAGQEWDDVTTDT